MKDRYVVDTNVLIAASAADPARPRDIDATPDDPALRQKILEWLEEFRAGDSRLVLDSDLKIYDEYCGRLDHQSFGVQVVVHKWSTSAYDNVDVKYDEDGYGVLPHELSKVVHDAADRKMVAAALASHNRFGEGCVAFGGDTDWHDWEDALIRHNVILEPIIEAWSRAKHAAKKSR